MFPPLQFTEKTQEAFVCCWAEDFLNTRGKFLAFGEDVWVKYVPYQLEGLSQYNFIKTWASSGRNSISGELDNGNLVLYISANLLRENNLLNKYGYWDFNWSEDRFILNGKVYKPSGDTQVAQASDEALLFFIILDREDPQENEDILQSYVSDTTIISSGKQSIIKNTNGRKVYEIIWYGGEPNTTPTILGRF